MPFYSQNVASEGMCPNSLSFHCSSIGFIIESIKEFGGALHGRVRSKSWWLGGSLATTAKREEKEDNNQHENHNKEGHEQLQTQKMQDLDHQDQLDRNNQEGCYQLQLRRRKRKTMIDMKITSKRLRITMSTKNARQGPPRSKSQWLKRLLVATTKREEKEDDDQHEDCDQEGCKKL